MAYPTIPALNQSQALNPSLWDGLIWAYLPGYSATTPIVGGGTLGGSTTTAVNSYTEGSGETFDLGEYRIDTVKPLDGTVAGAIHAHYRMLWTDDGSGSGVLGTAASTAWSNVGQLTINGTPGGVRGTWKRNGLEVFVDSPGGTHTASTNPTVNALTWRDSTKVGVRDFLVAEATVSGASIAGALSGTEPVIVASYYDRSASRSSNIAFFCGAIWNRVPTVGEMALIQADPYAVFQKASGGNATPTFPGPNIGNQTGSVGTALTPNTISDSFSDSDALTFTAIGSWPPGVTVSSAGVISGTPTTAGTYASLSVRATDTAAQTVDSDTFSFTISAATEHLITIANSQQINTASSGSISSPIGSDAYITIPPVRDWETENLKTGQTGVQVDIRSISTGALIVRKTGQTTHATTAVCTVTDPLIPHATLCEVMMRFADGSIGVWDLLSV